MLGKKVETVQPSPDSTPRILFPYTIESIPVHRKHPKFPRDPDFQIAVAASIL